MSRIYQTAAVLLLSQQASKMLQAHGAPASVTGLPVAHSVIFDTARELLRAGADRSAAVMQLRASYPALSVGDADKILREAATVLHAAGEIHDTEGA